MQQGALLWQKCLLFYFVALNVNSFRADGPLSLFLDLEVHRILSFQVQLPNAPGERSIAHHGYAPDAHTRPDKLCVHRRSPLELVFLASCHSRQVGETFIRDGGARYVVCVHRSEKVLDTATVVFSKVFYHVLLNGRSVREAFGVAQARVAAEPGTKHF